MGRYFLLNKPWGYVTARRDDRFPTVMDFFPEELRSSLHPVGRLDKDTEGLILLTDDGWFDYYLMRPEHHVPKVYFFHAFGEASPEKLQSLENGLCIGGTISSPARVELSGTARVAYIAEKIPPDYRAKMMKNPNGPTFSGKITITEGKTHQVRRMLRAVGCAVLYLERIAIGELSIELCAERGKFIELGNAELAALGYRFSE